MHWSTPASWVSGPAWLEGLPLRLDAFKYAEYAITLDGVKYAPFSINLRLISSSIASIHLFLVYPLCYLLPVIFYPATGRCQESISLTVDYGVCIPPIVYISHFPVIVMVVHHMKISMSAPAFIHPFINVHFLIRTLP